MKNKFYIDVFKALMVLGVILGIAWISGGLAAILVTISGLIFALRNKVGYLAVCYVIYPVLINFNHAIVKLDTLLAISARLGNLLLMLLMLLMGGRKGFERIPFFWLFAYCAVAAISSIGGWMPFISYLKLIQYVLFVAGILVLTNVVQQSDDGLYTIRCTAIRRRIVYYSLFFYRTRRCLYCRGAVVSFCAFRRLFINVTKF